MKYKGTCIYTNTHEKKNCQMAFRGYKKYNNQQIVLRLIIVININNNNNNIGIQI